MMQIFEQNKNIKTAYDLSQELKKWYDKGNCCKKNTLIESELYQWHQKVHLSELDEIKPVVKMFRKHQYEILNYFVDAHINAKAKTLNSKIQRFVAANYGYRDKDFVLYRIAGYFSQHLKK